MSNFKMRVKHSAPTLFAIGGIGAGIGAVIFSVKATIKAVKTVDEMKSNGEEITKQKVIKKVIPYYLPTIGFGAAAITCVFTSNKISVKRNKILTEENKELMKMCLSAGQVVTSLTKDKKEEIGEIVEETKDKKQSKKTPEVKSKPILNPNEEVIIFDTLTTSIFRTTYGRFKHAELELNSMLYENNLACGRVTLARLHELMGGESDSISRNYCWDQYVMANDWGECFIRFQEYPAVAQDGTPMILLSYDCPPVTVDEADRGY